MAVDWSRWAITPPAGMPSPSRGGSCTSRSRVAGPIVPFRIVYGACRTAGFTRPQSVTMTAICTPESSRGLGSWHRERNCSMSYSVWQLNSVHGFALRPCFSLLPATRLARGIYTSQGFGAWGAYSNGNYRAFLDEARAAQAAWESGPATLPPPPPSPPTLTALNPDYTQGRRRILIATRWKASAEGLARRFGVKISSGHRTPAANEAAGGVSNSNHLCGFAADYVGSAAAWARMMRDLRAAGYHELIRESDHVHVAFARCGATVPVTPTPDADPNPVPQFVTVGAAWGALTRAVGSNLWRRARAAETIAENMPKVVR